MVTKKKSKPEPQKTAKKARAPKTATLKPEQASVLNKNTNTSCASSCPQDTKELLSKLLAIYGSKYYILLAGASVGFMIGVVVDHLLIKG